MKKHFLSFVLLALGWSANAAGWNFSSGKTMYFNNSEAKWNKIYFRIGHSSHVSKTDFTKVSNTNNLYYCQPSGYNGAEKFVFSNNYGWTDSNNPIVQPWKQDDVIKPNDSSKPTGQTVYYGSNPTYNLLATTTGENNTEYGCTYRKTTWTDVTSSNYNTTLNSTQTLKQQVSEDEGAYADYTGSIATVKIATYKMESNSATSATATNATISSGASTTCPAALTATATLTVSGAMPDGYVFVGFFIGDNQLEMTENAGTYTATYEADAATTVIAKFQHSQCPNCKTITK